MGQLYGMFMQCNCEIPLQSLYDIQIISYFYYYPYHDILAIFFQHHFITYRYCQSYYSNLQKIFACIKYIWGRESGEGQLMPPLPKPTPEKCRLQENVDFRVLAFYFQSKIHVTILSQTGKLSWQISALLVKNSPMCLCLYETTIFLNHSRKKSTLRQPNEGSFAS